MLLRGHETLSIQKTRVITYIYMPSNQPVFVPAYHKKPYLTLPLLSYRRSTHPTARPIQICLIYRRALTSTSRALSYRHIYQSKHWSVYSHAWLETSLNPLPSRLLPFVIFSFRFVSVPFVRYVMSFVRRIHRNYLYLSQGLYKISLGRFPFFLLSYFSPLSLLPLLSLPI